MVARNRRFAKQMLTRRRVSAFAPPNVGSVDFDGASYYAKVIPDAGADGKQLTIVYWGDITNNDAGTIVELSFPFTSGKTTSMRTLSLRQRGTEQLRLAIGSSKSSNIFRWDIPPILDLTGFNVLALSVNITGSGAGDFSYMHQSDIAGLTFGNGVPSTNLGFNIEWSRETEVRMGARKDIIGISDYTLASNSLIYMNKTYSDFNDSAVREAVITASEYKNPQAGLGEGILMHSGDTSTFANNAGTLYDVADVVDTALADAIGPTPPFTL